MKKNDTEMSKQNLQLNLIDRLLFEEKGNLQFDLI